ncbi:MAG TPA: hypothetical protein VGW75_17475 [Solirubrobacteraceae bacterium]|nr:hypothetical protein [Solirubrobacteraceae bacterium]
MPEGALVAVDAGWDGRAGDARAFLGAGAGDARYAVECLALL